MHTSSSQASETHDRVSLPARDLRDWVRAFRSAGPVVALHSAPGFGALGRSTFVAGAPLYVVARRGDRWEVHPGREDGAAARAALVGTTSPFEGIERLLALLPSADPAGPPRGAFGYFGYECDAPEEGPERPGEAPPDLWFLITDTVARLGGEEDELWSPDAEVRTVLSKRASFAVAPDPPDPSLEASGRSFGNAAESGGSGLSLEAYRDVFERVRGHLRRGEAYQLCFTYPLRRPFGGDPWTLFEALQRTNPAPFSAYLDASRFAIVSSSPERFLHVTAAGEIEARPMKGTAPTGATPEQTRAARARLLASPKDRAENLMIADLLRNDIGRVSKLGSARITAAAIAEEYASVLQLISRVEGHLDPGRSRADLLASTFPPGSMTGAPKRRAVQLLRLLEAGPRGPYAGVLGYWSSDGRMDFSVLIRAWILASGQATCGVGGGLVWDSEVEAEHAETLLKGQVLLDAWRLATAGQAGKEEPV